MKDINFNKSEFFSLAESMDEVFPELVTVFFQETESSIDNMKNHIENKGWESVKDIGHSLKSSSRTFGAIGLSDISFQIEKFESNDEKEIDQLFQDFVSEYEAVKQLILTLQSESN
ncbi:hypothetical protein GCM10009133_05880 [Cocleimonas flava]|uniref:HPt (Histidine-containing phosphotransfer) domain-containing protein n=1 Tax=Cocleimonas flava TaxID=634765 RepID=A0A4R1EYN1_9GAMM|nr:Hpt domain-containing protein [Cocleimonas flava]TCJ86957.1 HPt (histidine-containing phosphotransfer) domain-containing protein [Cocleimonas flava]